MCIRDSYQEVSVDMKEAGVVYCPYAQEYSGWDGGNTVSFEMGPNSGGISEEETEVCLLYTSRCV